MGVVRLSAIAAAVIISVTPAHAADCKSIKDASARLACYDAAAAAPPSSKLDLVDFKTDKASLRGKSVELDGMLMPFAENALLSTGPGDLNPVFIDVRGVDRDGRRKLQACQPTCRGTVKGTVGTVSVGQLGIAATSIKIAE